MLNWKGTIEDLLDIAHYTACEKGWYDTQRTFPELICLVHCELSEAVEEYRNGRQLNEVYFRPDGKPEGVPIEIADANIRIADMCKAFDIDLHSAINMKLEYNKSRPYRHGGKKA